VPAETALGAIVHRIQTRTAFGTLLSKKEQILERVAEFRMV
jgi:hypothetical protein